MRSLRVIVTYLPVLELTEPSNPTGSEDNNYIEDAKTNTEDVPTEVIR